MKPIFFTFILLVILGTAWTLYLEYSNRHFIENLSKPPVPVTQSVRIADAPAMPESREPTTIATPAPDTPNVNTLTEREQNSLQRAPHAESFAQTESSENPFELEAVIFEEDTEGSTEDVLLEDPESSVTENEERRRARETMNRLMRDPSKLIYGGAGEPVSIFLMSEGEGEVFLETSALLEPTPEERHSLELRGDLQSLWNQIPSVIEVNGMQIHLPVRIPLDN